MEEERFQNTNKKRSDKNIFLDILFYRNAESLKEVCIDRWAKITTEVDMTNN